MNPVYILLIDFLYALYLQGCFHSEADFTAEYSRIPVPQSRNSWGQFPIPDYTKDFIQMSL